MIKTLFVVLFAGVLLVACGSNDQNDKNEAKEAKAVPDKHEEA